MTHTRSIPLAVFIAGLVASGCGGNSTGKHAASPNQKGAAATQSAQPARKNACELVPREQIETIAKEKIDMMHVIQSDDHADCELTSKASNALLVSVTVYWRGGKEIARTNQAAMSMAKQMMNDDEVDIEELTGSGKVRGLADKAYFSDLMPSWVLKGDALVSVISPRFGHDQTKGVFLAIAREALPKL